METFCVPFDALPLDRSELFRTLGYSDGRAADPYVAAQLERVLGEVSRVCRPRFGYALFPAEAVSDRTVSVAGTTFAVGKVIAACLEGASHFALFVATAGAEFADWTRRQALGGDVFRDFLIDAVGSEVAEAAGRALALRLAQEVGRGGLRIGNSYSPGYCGWNVRDQRRLFALLPANPCGVRLGDSCLMEPIKSISGVIPVGPDIEKKPYGCAICNNRNCYKKRKP